MDNKSRRLIDALHTTLPGLPSLVLKAREMGIGSNGADTGENSLQMIKKLVMLLSNQPLDVLKERVNTYEHEDAISVKVKNPVIRKSLKIPAMNLIDESYIYTS